MHYEKFSDGTIECIEKEIPYALPKNWKWCRLYQLTEAIPDAMADGPFGSNLKKEHYTNNQEVRIIQLSNIGENGWENHNKKYTTYSHASTLARSCVQQGTIVIAKMMPAGRAIIVPNIENNYILSSDVIKFVPHKKLNKEYLICALNSTTFLSQVAFGAHGVTRIRTSLSKLKEYLVPVPPLPEQNRIVSLFKSANSNIGTIINEKEALLDLLKITKSKILDLAIRGKLVPQDPNDEPASVLLERIRQEKEELIQAGKIKRDKNESIIFRGDDNSYYLRTGKLVEPLTDWSFDDLPKNWEICCFGEICNYGDCINTESSVIENSAWILDLEDIEKDTGRIVSRVSKADRPSISTKHKFHKGQVLYSKLRPYLNKVVLADRDGYCTSEILPLEFHAEIIPEYARYYLMSPTFLRYADKCSYGVKMPRLGTNDGKKAIFPLPPINEQRRIVKQIELMFSHLSGIEISVQ